MLRFWAEDPGMGWLFPQGSPGAATATVLASRLGGLHVGFPGGSDGKASACNVRDPASIPRSGRSPGEGNGNPLQYSCLRNPMDREACRATVYGVTKESDATA